MQKLLSAVAKGQARIYGDELRCANERDDTGRSCNKLIAKANRAHQIAGNFRCERCKEEIEVLLVPATRPGPRHPNKTPRTGGGSDPLSPSTRFGETHQPTPTREVSPHD